MTDTLAERFAALADPTDDSEWLDVRHRAAYRGSRPWVALGLAAALVALVVGSAFAYYTDVVDFTGAEKAPPKAVADFESLDVGAPPGMAPGAIASETRRIEVMGLNGTRQIVFVSPTKAGGFCFVFREQVGGCDKYGTTPLSPSWSERSIWGHVDARHVASVELHFADGSAVEPPITWVSSPIDTGFFFYTSTEGPELTSAVALDDEGNVVNEDELDLSHVDWSDRATPPADAVTEEKTEIASVSTSSGRAILWTAPTRYDGTCAWIELDGQALPFSIGCMPTGYWGQGLRTIVHATSETVLVHGSKSDRHPTVELRFADGETERVLAEGHFFLIEVPQSHHRLETRLMSVALRDAEGREQPHSRIELPAKAATGGPPCYQTLPLEPGQTCP